MLILEWSIGVQEGSRRGYSRWESKSRGRHESWIRSERLRRLRRRFGGIKISLRGIQSGKTNCQRTENLEWKIKTHSSVLDRQRDSRNYRGTFVNMQRSPWRSHRFPDRIPGKKRYEKTSVIFISKLNWSLSPSQLILSFFVKILKLIQNYLFV